MQRIALRQHVDVCLLFIHFRWLSYRQTYHLHFFSMCILFQVNVKPGSNTGQTFFDSKDSYTLNKHTQKACWSSPYSKKKRKEIGDKIPPEG